MGKSTKRDPNMPWGKRLLLAACFLFPLLWGLLLFVEDAAGKHQKVTWAAILLKNPSPMPAADFLGEIRAAGGWSEQIDLADLRALEKLQRCCAQHEWVERVQNVTLTAEGRIILDLVFRKPVARLRLAGQTYCVDREGKWLIPLPGAATEKLLELIGWENIWPLDERAKRWLQLAAQLAERLENDRFAWSIAAILLVRQPVLSPELRLQTEQKQQIIWQSLDADTTEEPTDADKISRLRVYFDRYGAIPSGQMLDVRSMDGILRSRQVP